MRRRHHRNPVRHFSFHRPMGLIKPVLIGSAGALAVNGAVNYLIPDSMKDTLVTGNMVYVTRGALALLLGMMGPKLPFIGRYASDMAKGALIVTATDFGKQLALQQGYNLSGLGYIGPGSITRMKPAGALSGPGTGMYVSGVARAGKYVSGR